MTVEDASTGTSDAEALSPVDWERRLQAAVEQTIARRAACRAERAEFKRRRNYGLARRHAAKLARLHASTAGIGDSPNPSTGENPPSGTDAVPTTSPTENTR